MRFRNRSIRFGLLLSAASLTAVASYAAAPAAGSKIGNQASATYVNASGDTINVTSNKVETVVQQVAGLTLVTDNTETVAPGGKVFLPHTITNDGNGTDSFNLTATEAGIGTFDFTDISIFPDANFDGVADSTTPISVTPTLAAGESYGFVIEATVPGGAAASTNEAIDVLATSQFSLTAPTIASASNTDTVTVSTGPVTEIVKSMTVDQGADGITGPGDEVTISLTYSSTGLAAATDLIVSDQLDQYLTYVDDSGIWSDDLDALTDNVDATVGGYEQENGGGFNIAYDYDGTDTVKFQIDSVPSGRTGTVTFRATINDDAPAGDILNIATQTVNGTAFPPSNEAKITVEPAYRVTAADAEAATHAGDPDGAGNLDAGARSSTDKDAAVNDIVTEDVDAFQGGDVTMEFVITNNANVTDTIDLSFANAAGAAGFPAGTTFRLVGADGATPIVGPLGPLASGASARVSIIATLPSNAPVVDNGASNYNVVLTAQSSNGGDPNSVTGLFTGAVLAAAVDLTNTGAPAATDGAGPGDGTELITTATDPGVPVTFPLTVTNNGPTADTYDLSLPNPLPPGWTVEFQLEDGTPITNTGIVPGGGTVDVVVVVSPPAGEAPGETPVQVAVNSPTSGQGDTITNVVDVNEIVDIALSTDQTVQVAPGGIADIPHVLTNEGNIAITEGAITPAAAGFSTFSGTLFWDVDNNGVVGPLDVVVDNIDDIGSIAPGASVSLLHRVQVPSNGAIGLTEAETLTVGTSLNSGAALDSDLSDNAITDTVTIVSGDLTLVKMQAVDPACNGTIGAFSAQDVQAAPGQCIRYKITADNTGTENADSVKIQDTVPGFTTLTECGGDCSIVVTPAGTSSVVSRPNEGFGGALETSHGQLIPGAPATLEFTVKIDE